MPMKKAVTAGLIVAVSLGLNAAAQDWYHDRENRYRGDEWRSQVFLQVRTDLDHVWSARRASDKERTRLEKTREELTKLQADLDHGRWDNGILNDVIDSVQKSANDDRLARRDREVLADDLIRLKDYQINHNHWRR
jgi:hypothetical protein